MIGAMQIMITSTMITSAPCYLIALLASGHATDDTPAPFNSTKQIVAGKHSITVDSGRLEIQEDHARADGPKISVAVCRLRGNPSGAPLFFFPGQPQSAIRTADDEDWAGFWSKCLTIGDVVLIDQRGLGKSRPNIVFESSEWKPWLLFSSEATARAHLLTAATTARKSWDQRGVSLSNYNILASVNDIEVVRSRIGYKKINLLGHSSGSQLALAYTRRFEGRVDRLICAGTAGTNDTMKPPLESDTAFRYIARMFADSYAHAIRPPDLESRLRDALNQLEQKPLLVEIIEPGSGNSIQIELGKFGFQFLLLLDLADKNDIPQIPEWIASVNRGDPSLVQPVLQKRINSMSRLPLTLLTSRASAGATPERWQQIDREAPGSIFGRARMLFCPDLATALGVTDLGDAFRSPVQSNVETLFVSGSLDANTPVDQAKRVQQGFPNSSHVILEHGGHNEVLFDRQVQQQMVHFLQGEPANPGFISSEPIVFDKSNSATSTIDSASAGSKDDR